MSVFCAIDYSMTSPSICVYDSKMGKFCLSNCKLFFYTDKKTFAKDFNHNIKGFIHKPYTHQLERFLNIRDWAMTIINHYKVTDVAIEGYSMGSKAGVLFDIAENTAALKYALYGAGIAFKVPAPTQIKKSFTGKGNAKKKDMSDTFKEKTGYYVNEIIDQKNPDSNPSSDIVDAFAICEWLVNNS